MKFEEALVLLKAGKRIIREFDRDSYDQQWLHYYDGKIYYMNEPWAPSPEWLTESLMAEDWIDVETDHNYHDCDYHQCSNQK